MLKTSLLRTIFFWVKGEKCSISSKWKALRPPAPGICPRSFLPLGEVREGRRGRGVGKQRRGIGRKGPLLWTWGSWCVETSGPVCVGAARGLNGADQEVKGKQENREQGASQSLTGFWEQCRDKDNPIDLSQGDLGESRENIQGY